jgi:hypothetical protein
MKAMPANRDHHERAEELLADIAGEAHTDRELTAMAAVAEAVLAVADVPEELGALLSVRPSEPPGPPGHGASTAVPSPSPDSGFSWPGWR